MPMPTWLRQVASIWGWGKLADVFFLSFYAEEPAREEILQLAAQSPVAQAARWALMGGDESREFKLFYGRSNDDRELYVLRPAAGPLRLVGEDEASFRAWLTGPGLDGLYEDPLGAPSPPSYAVQVPSLQRLKDSFEDPAPQRAERALDEALTAASRRRLGLEAVNLLADPNLKVTDSRRKELLNYLLKRTRKNIAHGIRGSLKKTIESIKKTGRLPSSPPTTIHVEGRANVEVIWDSPPTYLRVEATAAPLSRWILRVDVVQSDGIERVNTLEAVDADSEGRLTASSSHLLLAPRSARVSLVPLSTENEYIARGVNLFFHEDGSVSEDATDGNPENLVNRSPLHREDGPAELHGAPYRWPGRMGWWRHGKRHRDGGPALIVPVWGYTSKDEGHRGYVAYYVHGVLHREDGPAVIYANGDEEWWRQGERIEAPK
ncbi:MAG: hypothetical protein HY901_01755 [Deltaproteobacteria bacterium]|nr:hypothetical protein [Deltaproteobacteria bacterium]